MGPISTACMVCVGASATKLSPGCSPKSLLEAKLCSGTVCDIMDCAVLCARMCVCVCLFKVSGVAVHQLVTWCCFVAVNYIVVLVWGQSTLGSCTVVSVICASPMCWRSKRLCKMKCATEFVCKAFGRFLLAECDQLDNENKRGVKECRV